MMLHIGKLPKNYSRRLLTFFSIENPSLNCVLYRLFQVSLKRIYRNLNYYFSIYSCLSFYYLSPSHSSFTPNHLVKLLATDKISNRYAVLSEVKHLCALDQLGSTFLYFLLESVLIFILSLNKVPLHGRRNY